MTSDPDAPEDTPMRPVQRDRQHPAQPSGNTGPSKRTGHGLPASTGGRDYTSAVYGSVLAATVIVSAGDLRAPAALAALLLVSGVVFWIAHVYAATVAGRHGGWHTGSVRAGMLHEWPVAFAAVPPAIAAAVCGLIPGVNPTAGAWVALLVAIGEQQLWGYAAIRHARLTGRDLTRTMLLNVLMGVVVVALKFAVGH